MSALKQRLETLWHSHGREIAQFLSVGGLAFIINSVVTWSLMHSVFSDGHAKAKVVAGVVATVCGPSAKNVPATRYVRLSNSASSTPSVSALRHPACSLASMCWV